MKEEHKFFINGVWVDPSFTEIIEVENPATEEIIGTIAAGSKEDISDAVEAAKNAFATFGSSSKDERIALLESIITNYEDSSEELAAIISEEMGAPLWLSKVAQVTSGLQHFKDTLEVVEKIKFINSYSFIFSPRPGTKAANFELVDKKISLERLKIIQSLLFDNQSNKNKSLENKTLNILVENLAKNEKYVFGRTEFMTPVIFQGEKSDIGKILSVKIKSSNRSTLFGEKVNDVNKKVA